MTDFIPFVTPADVRMGYGPLRPALTTETPWWCGWIPWTAVMPTSPQEGLGNADADSWIGDYSRGFVLCRVEPGGVRHHREGHPGRAKDMVASSPGLNRSARNWATNTWTPWSTQPRSTSSDFRWWGGRTGSRITLNFCAYMPGRCHRRAGILGMKDTVTAGMTGIFAFLNRRSPEEQKLNTLKHEERERTQRLERLETKILESRQVRDGGWQPMRKLFSSLRRTPGTISLFLILSILATTAITGPAFADYGIRRPRTGFQSLCPSRPTGCGKHTYQD